MGNYRFKFSDMIPNAWFYKLRDMGSRVKKQTNTTSRTKNQTLSSSTTKSSKPKQTHHCNPRRSYYFTRELTPNTNNCKPINSPEPEPPRKSSKTRRRRRRTSRTSSSSPKLVTSRGCICRTTLESVWTKSNSPPENSSASCSPSPFDSSAETESPDPEFRTDRVLLPAESSSFDEMVSLSTTSCPCTRDIVIDVDKNSLPRKDDKLEECDEDEDEDDDDDGFSELVELPPIITKPPKFNNLLSNYKTKEPKPRSRITKPNEEKCLKVRIVKEEQRISPVLRRFSSASSPGVKLRVNSPRIASLKLHHGRLPAGSRRSFSGSCAVVKSSFNPQKDFRESMVEMIVENNIRASKDLEDLLACYLSLNSDEYHDLIIKVFKQIWFDLTR